MAYLTADQVRRLKSIEGNGYGDTILAELIEQALEPAIAPEAANVAALGTLATVGVPTQLTIALLGVITPLTGVDGTGDNAAPLIGTNAAILALQEKIDAVVTAIDAVSTAALATGTNTRIATLQVKIDAIIAAMIAAGLMAP